MVPTKLTTSQFTCKFLPNMVWLWLLPRWVIYIYSKLQLVNKYANKKYLKILFLSEQEIPKTMEQFLSTSLEL